MSIYVLLFFLFRFENIAKQQLTDALLLQVDETGTNINGAVTVCDQRLMDVFICT
jgi:hypothetical protein